MLHKTKRIHGRGTKTSELPFLMSCVLHLLNERLWILGIRYPWRGTRFDVIAKDPRFDKQIVLVEAKFRSDKRAVKPHEVERFAKEIRRAEKRGKKVFVKGIFMTNSYFSSNALEIAKARSIMVTPYIPTIFGLKNGKGKNGKNCGAPPLVPP